MFPRRPALSARNVRIVFAIAWPVHMPTNSLSAVVRPASSSDSDSDYGARAHKKKKKLRASAEEVRVSSRGIRVPNYVDDIQDFEKLEEVDDDSNGYYVDPNIQYQEEDEIEAVLAHSREEGRESDEKDVWYENVVSACRFFDHCLCPFIIPSSGSISSGKTFLTSTTPTRPMNSSNVSGA